MSEWDAVPAGPHYADLSDDLDSTYVEEAAPSKSDTYDFTSANVPANTLIESVELDYTWEASSGYGSIRPLYRQDGTTVAGPETSASNTDGWHPGGWQLTYNPVTGSNWTGADVDALEMGVETGALGNARVSKITVSVVYRTRKASTIYIGGVYEKNLNANGTVAGVVEYYAAMGRTIAMRTIGASGGAGTLVWPLLDQLGSTVAETDAGGTVLSRQDYWPYGTTRSVQAYAPVTETDRLYTGQQQVASGDPALGLYNYKARFYSTTLGRFVSADTVADGLDRYEYVHDNPARYADPSGATALIACGTGNSCQNGNDIGEWKNLVIEEWRREGRFPGASDALYDIIFKMLKAALAKPGYDGYQSAAIFGDVFFDTTRAGLPAGLSDVAHDMGNAESFLGKVSRFLGANTTYFGANGANIWAGYSWGGAVVYAALIAASGNGALPDGAILIEPAIGVTSLPVHVLDEVRVLSLTDPDLSPVDVIGGVHGSIEGAWNFVSNDCGGDLQHCTHSGRQALLVDIATDVTAGGAGASIDIARRSALARLKAYCNPLPDSSQCQ